MVIIGGWGEKGFADEVKLLSTQNLKPRQKFINGTYPEDYPRQAGVPKKGAVVFYYPEVEASKGCFWGACSYCLRPLNEEQGKWKQHNPEDILSQVEDLFELGYKLLLHITLLFYYGRSKDETGIKKQIVLKR